jgi:hypothetical protein
LFIILLRELFALFEALADLKVGEITTDIDGLLPIKSLDKKRINDKALLCTSYYANDMHMRRDKMRRNLLVRLRQYGPGF